MKIDNDKLLDAFNRTYNKYNKLFGSNDSSFCYRVFAEGISKYLSRLKAIGFENLEHLLDLGCGFGQWTIPLALINNFVEAIDISSGRLFFLDNLIKDLELKNINIQWSDINQLPYERNSFNGIFCYGVIHLSNWKKTLLEINRVLKPEGLLYVNALGLGWFIHCWLNEPNKVKDFSPKLNAGRTLYNTALLLEGKTPVDPTSFVIDCREMENALHSTGFEILGTGGEGTVNLSGVDLPIQSNFKGNYYGFEGVYEIVAQKKLNK
jgi:SAM-dependent methyltransferase